MAEERRVSPAVVIGIGAVIGIAAVVGIYALAGAAPPVPPEGYPCPYCPDTFSTYEELVEHVQSVHPGERIPIEIIWE